jgi:hypothetical protein
MRIALTEIVYGTYRYEGNGHSGAEKALPAFQQPKPSNFWRNSVRTIDE